MYKDCTTTHTLDLDEHKEQDRENARRTLAKRICIDDFKYVQRRQRTENYIFVYYI